MKDKAWSLHYYELFFDVFESGCRFYKIEVPKFNFDVKREANFNFFKLVKKCLDKDIENYYLREHNRPATDEEYYASVRVYFRRGFCYCYYYTYEKKLVSHFNYSPLLLYNKYNSIISFKAPKKKTW